MCGVRYAMCLLRYTMCGCTVCALRSEMAMCRTRCAVCGIRCAVYDVRYADVQAVLFDLQCVVCGMRCEICNVPCAVCGMSIGQSLSAKVESWISSAPTPNTAMPRLRNGPGALLLPAIIVFPFNPHLSASHYLISIQFSFKFYSF